MESQSIIDEVDVELEENFEERPSVLSGDDNISNSLKRGGTEDIKLFNTLMIHRETSRHKNQTYEKLYVDSFYLWTMTKPHWGYVLLLRAKKKRTFCDQNYHVGWGRNVNPVSYSEWTDRCKPKRGLCFHLV